MEIIFSIIVQTLIASLFGPIKKLFISKLLKQDIETFCIVYYQDILSPLEQGDFIDSDNLILFVRNKFHKYLKAYIYSQSLEEQYSIMNQILEDSFTAAKAESHSQKDLVESLINGLFELSRKHFVRTLPNNQRIILVDINKSIQQTYSRLLDEMKKNHARILEELHTQSELIKYSGSFAEYIDNIKISARSVPYHYSNTKAELVGREDELYILREFLDDDVSFSHLVITGQAGVGKSKLLNHFISRGKPCWKMLFLPMKSFVYKYRQFNNWYYPENLLLVIDYAQIYSTEINRFFYSIVTANLSRKIRVVILERDSAKLFDGESNPYWYTKVLGSPETSFAIESTAFSPFEKSSPILELEPLSSVHLRLLIHDYLLSNYNKEISDEEITDILKKLEEIDPLSRRPLFCLFIAEVWLDSNDFSQWTRVEILDYLYKKYLDRINTASNSTRFLVCLATITGSIHLNSFKYPSTNITSALSHLIENPHFLNIINESDAESLSILPLTPDLFGEYFSLRILHQKEKDTEFCKTFLDFAYKRSPHGFLDFYLRSVMDFSKTAHFNSLLNFDGLIQNYLNGISDVEFSFVVQLLLASCSNPSYVDSALSAIKSRFEKNGASHVIASLLCYALLSKNAYVSNYSSKSHTKNEIENIYSLHNSSEIAFYYSVSLYNLSNEIHDTMKKTFYISIIQSLFVSHRDSPYASNILEIVLMSLYNKFFELNSDIDRDESMVDSVLEEMIAYLSDENKSIYHKASPWYIRALNNAICKSNIIKADELCKRAEDFLSKNMNIKQLAEEYASCLYNALIGCTFPEKREIYLSKLESLHEISSDNNRIIYELFSAYSHLIEHSTDMDSLLVTLRKLASMPKGNNSKTLYENLSMSLFVLYNKSQNSKIKLLCETKIRETLLHSQSNKIAYTYGKILVNIICDFSDPVIREEAEKKLLELCYEYENVEVISTYSAGIFHMQFSAGKNSYSREEVEAAILHTIQQTSKLDIEIQIKLASLDLFREYFITAILDTPK